MATGVDARLLKSTKFPPEFSQKVDMQLVNLPVMKKWIAGRISETLGSEDDVIIELCFNLLEIPRFPDIKSLQIQLTGFLEKDTPVFCRELWKLLLSAQSNPQGVPKELLEAKKMELIEEKKKLEADRAVDDARRKQNEADRTERNANNQRGRGQSRPISWRGRRLEMDGQGESGAGGRELDHAKPQDIRHGDQGAGVGGGGGGVEAGRGRRGRGRGGGPEEYGVRNSYVPRDRNRTGIAGDRGRRRPSDSPGWNGSRSRSGSRSQSPRRARSYRPPGSRRRERSTERFSRKRSPSPTQHSRRRPDRDGVSEKSARRRERSTSSDRRSPALKRRRRRRAASRVPSRDRTHHHSRERSRSRSPVASKSRSMSRDYRPARQKVSRGRRGYGHRDPSRTPSLNSLRPNSPGDNRRRAPRSQSSSKTRRTLGDRRRDRSPVRSKHDTWQDSADNSSRGGNADRLKHESRRSLIDKPTKNDDSPPADTEMKDTSEPRTNFGTKPPVRQTNVLKEKLLREKILQMRSSRKGSLPSG